MGAFTANSTAPSTRRPSASTFAGIAGHSTRHFNFSDQTQAGLKRLDAQTGSITLIQRFGPAANLNIHLHCLVLDAAYRIRDGVPEFHSVRSPATAQLQGLLNQIIKRIMKALTRHGALIEEEGLFDPV